MRPIRHETIRSLCKRSRQDRRHVDLKIYRHDDTDKQPRRARRDFYSHLERDTHARGTTRQSSPSFDGMEYQFSR